tara:strand:+ start:1541 stop:1801 length:261 start_codon:yes stop_codon:yes gene_type:complete
MVGKIGQYYIFYRHFLYGSALTIGTIIGTDGNISGYIPFICLCVGCMLMSVSVFVTVTINMYPEEFERELESRKSNLPSSSSDTSD